MNKHFFTAAIAVVSFFMFSFAWAEDQPAKTITYKMAEKAMAAALEEARANEWNLTIVIADKDGLPVMIHRMDGAFPRSYNIAMAKVKVVTETGLLSGEYGRRLKEGDIKEVEGGVTYAGGVPIIIEGERIGAITASGARGSEDEQVAKAAAAAIGA